MSFLKSPLQASFCSKTLQKPLVGIICYGENFYRHFSGNGPPKPTWPGPVEYDAEGFRILRIQGYHYKKAEESSKFQHPAPEIKERLPPREKRLPLNQDWTDVWPTAATFNPSVVPLPIRQGHVGNLSECGGIVPDKYHNAELMKIPNFLHLTPKHIAKHTAVLKKFCTRWPAKLDDAMIEKKFPVKITTRDYLLTKPTIRDPRARVVTMKVNMKALELDEHAEDKMIRLLEDRYDKKTGEITLTADRCPQKVQNLEYIRYLLTALYFESWKFEEWENGKERQDHFYWSFEGSPSEKKLNEEISKSYQVKEKAVGSYSKTLETLHNEGENEQTWMQYKQAVSKMLGIPTLGQ